MEVLHLQKVGGLVINLQKVVKLKGDASEAKTSRLIDTVRLQKPELTASHEATWHV